MLLQDSPEPKASWPTVSAAPTDKAPAEHTDLAFTFNLFRTMEEISDNDRYRFNYQINQERSFCKV